MLCKKNTCYAPHYAHNLTYYAQIVLFVMMIGEINSYTELTLSVNLILLYAHGCYNSPIVLKNVHFKYLPYPRKTNFFTHLALVTQDGLVNAHNKKILKLSAFISAQAVSLQSEVHRFDNLWKPRTLMLAPTMIL